MRHEILHPSLTMCLSSMSPIPKMCSAEPEGFAHYTTLIKRKIKQIENINLVLLQKNKKNNNLTLNNNIIFNLSTITTLL